MDLCSCRRARDCPGHCWIREGGVAHLEPLGSGCRIRNGEQRDEHYHAFIARAVPSLKTAWQDVDSSFERFCLTAGIGAIEQMLCEDAQQLVGAPQIVAEGASATAGRGKIGFHGGKVAVHSPRMLVTRP